MHEIEQNVPQEGGHTHPHEHSHEHPHTHEHAVPADGDTLKKTVALLSYMVEHNKAHAQEVHDLSHELSADGKKEAASLIHRGFALYREGNELLERALAALKEEG